MLRSLTILVVSAAISVPMLCSCGSSSDTVLSGIHQQPATGVNHAPGKPAESVTSHPAVQAASDEREGPQYQEPTIENLKGVPQLFPAKYTLKRYPKSEVALVKVRPNPSAGDPNQVMLKSSDPTPRIAGYYKNMLSQEGWEVVDQNQTPIYSSTVWQKDGQQVEVRVSLDRYNRENIQLFSGPVVPQRKIAKPRLPG